MSSIHVVAYYRVLFIFWFLWIIQKFALGWRYLFHILFSFPLVIYPAVRLLDSEFILLLILWQASILFSTWLHQFLFPSGVHWNSFSTSSSIPLTPCLLIMAFLKVLSWLETQHMKNRPWHLVPSLHGKQKGEKWKQW